MLFDESHEETRETVREFVQKEINPYADEWEEAKMEAVDKRWEQEQRYWLGYRLGNAKVQTGWEPVSVMSPAYEYHKGRTFPVWEEVK